MESNFRLFMSNYFNHSIVIILSLLMGVYAQSVAAVLDYNDAYVYYSFDEGSGATVADSSGNNRDGDITDAIWTSSGVVNSALQFDGTDDDVVIGTGSEFSDLCLNGCTFSAWIKMPTAKTTISPVMARYQAASNLFFRVVILGDRRLAAIIDDNGQLGNWCGELRSHNLVPLNKWTHIVARYDSINDTLSLFIDGVSNGSLQCSFDTIDEIAWQESETTYIGTYDEGNPNRGRFKGDIDEVAIFDRALSDSEVLELLTARSLVNPPVDQTYVSHGPLVGHTTSTSARVWARADQSAVYQIVYSQNADLSYSETSSAVNFTAATDFTGTVDINGLTPNTTYYYSVALNGYTKDLPPYSSFTTFPMEGSPVDFSFAFGSSSRDPLNGLLFTIFDAIAAKQPAFMLQQGDFVYADRISQSGPTSRGGPAFTLEGYRDKYREFYENTPAKNLLRDISMYTQWDDHEIVNNWNGKQSTALYANGSQASAEYQYAAMPDVGVDFDGDRRRYYSFSYGDVEFFILDNRSFRNISALPPTMLGAEQKQWLKDALSSSTAKIKIVSSSVYFNDFSTTGDDSWVGYTAERDEIFDYIGDNDISSVVLLSGDQHWSIMVRHDRSATGDDYIYEFGVSPLTAQLRTKTSSVDPSILWKYDGGRAFGLVMVDTSVSPATMLLEAYDENGDLISGSSFLLALPEPADPDGDGVPMDIDNCLQVANADQRDTNGDGYGNFCDGDLNGDGFVNSLDLGLFKAQILAVSPDPDMDINGDGFVNSQDIGLFRDLFFQSPGPSALAP